MNEEKALTRIDSEYEKALAERDTLCIRRVRRGIFSCQGASATLQFHYIRHNPQSQ